ncbi:MAG: ATP-dependent helicase [Thermoplasmata archaeon]
MIRRVRKQHTKKEVLSLMLPLVREWFNSKFDGLTEPQAFAVPIIHARQNVLISSPTGSGKTITAFLSIINELLAKQEKGELEDKIYCVYISPLKALANDIDKNLKQPLKELEELAERKGMAKPRIRVAVRSGDTPSSERQKMVRKPPHILITTPESLAIILSTPKFSQALHTAEWLIMDEIHDICSSKRGVHLSVSLERLESHLDFPATRIGLSATQAPIEEMARFLGGYDGEEERNVRLVEVASNKKVDIEVMTPVEDMTAFPFEIINARMYEKLRDTVMENTTTLVFTNTRSGTENVLLKLGELGVEDIAAHHGSLSRETRLDVEDRLKGGHLRAAVSSTSLELGIDIGSIDMVCQIGSPKSIAKGLQRVGRSGHGYGEVSRGKLIAFDNDDLVECAVLAKKASENFIDRVDLPRNSLDVLAQTIVGMALEKAWKLEDAYAIIKNSYSFHELEWEDFISVVHYLSSRDMPHVYSKIWLDDETGEFGKKKSSRLIYYLNSGTIPEEANYKVYSDSGGRLGELSEGFVERLSPGDVFVLGGRAYEFIRAREMSIFVKPATGRRPTIPSWTGEMLPRSYDLSVEIGRFRGVMARVIDSGKDPVKWLLDNYPVDMGGARTISSFIGEQAAFNSAVPTDRNLLIEGYLDPKKNLNVIFHYCFGRRANDALSRAYAMAVSNKFGCNVSVSINDDCFMLTVPGKISLEGIEELVTPDNVVPLLVEAIRDTELFKQRFRHCSTRGLMVLRNYQGREVPVGRQQQRSQKVLRALEDRDSFPIVKETVSEIMNQAMSLDAAAQILGGIRDGSIKVSHAGISDVPSPFAHNIVLVGMSDIVLMHDRSALLKELHRKVLMRVGGVDSLKPEFEPELVERYFREKRPAIAGAADIPGILSKAGALEIFTRKNASIYDFSELPESELAAMAAHALESGTIASAWAGRSLFCHSSELERFAALYGTGKAPDKSMKAILDMLSKGPATALSLARKLEPDPKDIRRDISALERAYMVARVGQDAKANTIWAVRSIKPAKPDAKFLRKLVQRHIEYFAPLTMDELAYGLALQMNTVSEALGELDARGLLASGSFTAPELQYMLVEDRARLQGRGHGDAILQPQVENYLLAKHTAPLSGLDDYFERYGIAWMPQDVLARCPKEVYGEWLERRKNGSILHGRFMDGSVCFVREMDAWRYVTIYRNETLTAAEKAVLDIITASNGTDIMSLGRDTGLPAEKLKSMVDKLDRNMFIVRKFVDRESWSTFNRYIALETDPQPEKRGEAIRHVLLKLLEAHAPMSARALAQAAGFTIRDVKAILASEISSGKVVEFSVEGSGREKYLVPANEMDALRAQPSEPLAGVRVLTLYDPITMHHRVELRRRFGDAWYYPIFDGPRCVGMMEMWEMSGCLDIREVMLDDTSMLPAFLKALDVFSWYFKQNLMGLIRLKRVLGRDIRELDPAERRIILGAGYREIREWLVKGPVEDLEITDKQFISYLLWKQHILPKRRFPSIHDGLKAQGGFRSDEAAAIRCDYTIPLKKLHKLDIVAYGQIIPRLMTYALHDEVALHKAALDVRPDEQMSLLMSMFKEEGPLKWSKMVALSPLGYGNTLDARQKLAAGLFLLRNSDNDYYLTPDSGHDPRFARKEVVRRIFRQFGILSAEMLGYYTKGEYRMFEIRTILQELEDEGFLVKGYFLRSEFAPNGQSDSLHWLVKEDLKQIRKRPAKFDAVLTARDNLAYYLVPFVSMKFGLGSSWIAISNGELIGAASVQLKKAENLAIKFEGSQKAWDMLRAHSVSLGKRMVMARDKPQPSEADDVEDWYEKYVRPGG